MMAVSAFAGSVPRVRLLQDGGRLPGKVEYHTIWAGCGRVVTQTDVPGRWYGLRAAETGYSAGQEGACLGFRCDVWNGNGFWPYCEAANCSEALYIACIRLEEVQRGLR
jgi:hypothetical protein